MRIMNGRTASRTAVALSVAVAASLFTGCAASTDTGGSDPGATVAKDTALQKMLPADIKQAGVLKVGTEAFYPPFEYLAEDNVTVTGLDMDLFRAIGDKLGLKVEITNMAFDGLLPALDGKRIDVVAAAMTDTKARQAKYDFVDYFLTGQGIIVPKGNPKHLSDFKSMCGLNVSVLDASLQQTLLQGFNKNECAAHPITILAMSKDSDALLQVKSGRADAAFSQDAVARYNVNAAGAAGSFQMANAKAMDPVVTGPMFAKNNSKLRDAVKAAVGKLIEDGTYQKVLKKHNVSSGAVSQVTINGGKI